MSADRACSGTWLTVVQLSAGRSPAHFGDDQTQRSLRCPARLDRALRDMEFRRAARHRSACKPLLVVEPLPEHKEQQ